MGRKAKYYAGMKSREYWHQRMLDRDKKSKLSEDKIIKKIRKAYHNAYIEISKELNDFYNKYAIENNLTYTEATKLLNLIELGEYRDKVQELRELYNKTNSKEILIEWQRIGARENVTRLQSLLDAIDIQLIKHTNNMQMTMTDHLTGAYKRTYKEALKDVGRSNAVLPKKAIEEAIRYPWSGRQFSGRIWTNKTATLNKIQETITKGLIQGQSVQKMGSEVRKFEKVTKYEAERLIRTETNFFTTKGHIDGYKENGIKAVEVCVAYDERTCADCESMDREVVKIEEISYGSNVPPFHCFCRTMHYNPCN